MSCAISSLLFSLNKFSMLPSKLIAALATDTEKQSSSLPRQDQIIPEQTTDTEVRRTVDKQSHEEGELSPENGAFVNNGHDTKAEFSEPAKQHANSEDSNDNRFCLLLS